MAIVQNETSTSLIYDFGPVVPQRKEGPISNDTFNKCVFPIEHGIPIVIINIIFSIFGTVGNFLIIMVVWKTPKLRRVSNFLLLSLAVADLLVTIIAQPMQVTTVAAKTFGHFCIPQVDFTYDIMANFSCSCSLFHLAAISIDRAIVIAKPHDYQSIMAKKGVRAMIGGCWGIALLFVSLRVPFPETLILSVAMIFISYFTITVSYTIILFQITREKVSRHMHDGCSPNVSRNARMERRVAGTIAIVILVFSICWFPLVGFYVSMKEGLLRTLAGIPYMWIRTILLLNSSMNFLIYSFRIDHFRSAYKRMVCKWIQRSRAWLASKSSGTTSPLGGTLSSSKYSASIDQDGSDI